MASPVVVTSTLVLTIQMLPDVLAVMGVEVSALIEMMAMMVSSLYG
jgi:hypothetical protein